MRNDDHLSFGRFGTLPRHRHERTTHIIVDLTRILHDTVSTPTSAPAFHKTGVELSPDTCQLCRCGFWPSGRHCSMSKFLQNLTGDSMLSFFSALATNKTFLKALPSPVHLEKNATILFFFRQSFSMEFFSRMVSIRRMVFSAARQGCVGGSHSRASSADFNTVI